MPTVPVPGAAPSASKFKIPSVGEIRKALVALVAVLGVVTTQFALSGTAAHVVTVVIAGIGSVLTYVIPNAAPSA